jgi:tRNA 2-thiouridine synthesizing protein E
MSTENVTGAGYPVDQSGFLVEFDAWDEGFVKATAPSLKIQELRDEHWSVISYIRTFYRETGHCPLVYQTCRGNGLSHRELEALFPTGYLRGACRLAGVSTRAAYPPFAETYRYREIPPEVPEEGDKDRAYHIDAFGFLLDPSTWDRGFARLKAFEMKLPGGLGEGHWRVLDYLRGEFERAGSVPTVIQTCNTLGLELDDLEALFPDGYNRGAVKIAGLRPESLPGVP